MLNIKLKLQILPWEKYFLLLCCFNGISIPLNDIHHKFLKKKVFRPVAMNGDCVIIEYMPAICACKHARRHTHRGMIEYRVNDSFICSKTFYKVVLHIKLKAMKMRTSSK